MIDSPVVLVVLRIHADGDQLRVTIQYPDGEASEKFDLPADLWRDLAGARVGSTARSQAGATRQLVPFEESDESSRSPSEIGECLFLALFPGRIRACLERARGRAQGHLRLLLQWNLDDPRIAPLHRLPWELLKDPDAPGFLVLDRELTLLRSFEVPDLRRQPSGRPARLRVIAVASSPSDLRPLDLTVELDGLAALARENTNLEVRLPDPNEPAELTRVRRRIRDSGGNVLHWMGHGEMDPQSGRGQLFFENENGRANAVAGEDLAQELADLAQLRLVVLNACRTAEIRGRPFAGVATALVRSAGLAVVAMQAPISDAAAITFAHTLYRQLARGEPLDLAVCEARHAVFALFPDQIEWALPVLFARAGDPLLLPGDLPDVDDSELRDHYLAWMVERYGEIEQPWISRAGGPGSLDLEFIPVLFRRDRTPPSERPQEVVESTGSGRELYVDELSPEEENVRTWKEIRRIARGEMCEREGSPDREARKDPNLDSLIALDNAFCNHRRIVLLGDAGSGKTCILQWLAVLFAKAARERRPRALVPANQLDSRRSDPALVDLGPVRLPVVIHLARFVDRRGERPELRLIEYLGRHLGATLESPAVDARGRELPPDALHALLRRELDQRGIVLLLDGLDEVNDPDSQQSLLKELESAFAVFLPKGDGIPAIDGGSQVVLTSRPAGYLEANLGSRADHFLIEPLHSKGISLLCRQLVTQIASEGGGHLVEIAESLRQLSARDLVSTPLMLATLATILSRSGGRLPEREVDLYEPAVAVLLARWLHLTGQSAGTDGSRLREMLAELAAESRSRLASHGLIHRNWLVPWLKARPSSADQETLDLLLHRDVGPLIFLGGDLFAFLHAALQEYLAACWLSATPAIAEERIRARLGDPAWRRPSAMALGLLAEKLMPEELEGIFERLLDSVSPPFRDRPLPHEALLILKALAELPPGIEVPRVFAKAIREVLKWTTEDEGGPFSQALEKSLSGLLVGSLAQGTARALAQTLREAQGTAGRPAWSALAGVARLVFQAAAAPPELAAALLEARADDQAPWLIECALRQLAESAPESLPAPIGSLRRALARDPILRRAVESHPSWRRLVLTLGGGCPGSSIPPYRLSGLDPLLIETLRSGTSPDELIPNLMRRASDPDNPTAPDAAAALAALAVDGSPTIASSSTNFDRYLVGVEHAKSTLPDLLVHLALAAPTSEKAIILGLLWRILLWEPSSDRDPRHRLAILLDTRGAMLCDPLEAFYGSWLAAVGSTNRPTKVAQDRVAETLDVLAAIPSHLDFVRGWALTVLRPILELHDFLPEAQILAEVSISDRLGARENTRLRLSEIGSARLGDRALLEKALAIAEPWRRYRALRWLHLFVAELRAELTISLLEGNRILWAPMHAAASAIRRPEKSAEVHLEVPPQLADLGWQDPENAITQAVRRLDERRVDSALDLPLLNLLLGSRNCEETSRTQIEAPPDISSLDRAVAALDAEDDLAALEARLSIHGDRSNARRRWSARALGCPALLHLAKLWQSRHRCDPKAALPLRWAFERIRQDSPEVLRKLRKYLDSPGLEADAAEIVLRNLEEVEVESAGMLKEILVDGPDRGRRALIEALPNLLVYAGARAEAAWGALGEHLPLAAKSFGDLQVDLEGPEGIVASADQAWSELVSSGGNAVRRAQELHKSSQVPWEELLQRDSVEVRKALEDLGRRRRVGLWAERRTAEAAERVTSNPNLLPLLISWLEESLWLAPQRPSLDDHTTSNLLELVAAAGWQLPRTLARATADRPLWRVRLRETVEFADWLPARRAAIELLSLGRSLGEIELGALFVALNDGPEVQQAALTSLRRYRRLEHPDLVEVLAKQLAQPRASRAYAAARLLAEIAKPAACASQIRYRIEKILLDLANGRDSGRLVYVASVESSPFARSTGIDCLGSLASLTRGLLLEIHAPSFFWQNCSSKEHEWLKSSL